MALAVEYCHLLVSYYHVDNDEKKKRGWRNNGVIVTALQQTESGYVTHELNAFDISSGHGSTEDIYNGETRRGFIALLNRLALEG